MKLIQEIDRAKKIEKSFKNYQDVSIPLGSTIAVGMSGGVDSSVVALILKNQGYNVKAFFMRNWDSAMNLELNNILTEEEICKEEEDYQDAKNVCEQLDIELTRIDFVKEYWDNVFKIFLEEIKLGITPNPDIICNKKIKFKLFTDYIFKNNPEIKYVATGHYANIKIKDNKYYLTEVLDDIKDQTYFLAEIDPKILSKVIFPLANYTKKQVRDIAIDNNLLTAYKKDSTGICFIGKRNFPTFISNYLKENPGDIIDYNSNKKIGTHKGAIFYTIGQRRGLNLGGFEKPYFVAKKDVNNNIIYVSNGTDEVLFTDEIESENFNLLVDLSFIEEIKNDIYIKIRHSNVVDEAKIISIIKNKNSETYKLLIKTNKKIKAVSPGQELVIYHNFICLGGGKIK